jgi:hypothetical protein
MNSAVCPTYDVMQNNADPYKYHAKLVPDFHADEEPDPDPGLQLTAYYLDYCLPGILLRKKLWSLS